MVGIGRAARENRALRTSAAAALVVAAPTLSGLCGHCPCLANPLTGIAMLSPSLSTLLQAAMLWVWLIMQSGGPPPLLLALALAVGLGGPIALQAFFLDTCLATRVELRGLEGLKYRCKNA
jgi:hypothetical protein